MNCEHPKVQWFHDPRGRRTHGVCVECGDELEDLGDQVVPAASAEKGGPVAAPARSDREIRADALREDRFLEDPMKAPPARRIQG